MATLFFRYHYSKKTKQPKSYLTSSLQTATIICNIHSFTHSFIRSFIHSIAMRRIRRFLAVLRSLFCSSLLRTFSCHPSPPTTGCFKKSFTTLKAYRNLYRGHTQRFEMSKCSKTHRVLPRIVICNCFDLFCNCFDLFFRFLLYGTSTYNFESL